MIPPDEIPYCSGSIRRGYRVEVSRIDSARRDSCVVLALALLAHFHRTHRQDGTQGLAQASLARRISRSSLGGALCVRGLFCLLLEPAERCTGSNRLRDLGLPLPPHADANLAVPARGGHDAVLFFADYFSAGAYLRTWSALVFPHPIRVEVTARVLALLLVGADGCRADTRSYSAEPAASLACFNGRLRGIHRGLLASRLNISLRHFSVPHVVLILMLAPLPGMVSRPFQWLIAALAVSCLVTVAMTYPFYIPYVNSLGMGKPAYALVNGSNVDWNEGLPELARFMRDHQLPQIKLDFVALSDPAAIMPGAEPWGARRLPLAMPANGSPSPPPPFWKRTTAVAATVSPRSAGGWKSLRIPSSRDNSPGRETGRTATGIGPDTDVWCGIRHTRVLDGCRAASGSIEAGTDENHEAV